MKKLLFTASLFTVIFTQGQEINIIPQPAQLEVKKGNFQLSKSTVLVVLNKGDQATASFLNSYLQTYYRLKLPVVNKAPKANYIGFSTWNDTAYRDEKESYQLIVDPKFIRITANGHAGSFYGMQSLIQLLPVVKPQDANVKIKALSSYAIPAVVIEDKPRFSYRGVHFDVCRHFFPVAYVKQYIDYLALHKFNTFHWHLTDDQGWRIEIKKYPKLTSVGGWRNGTIIGRYPGKGNDSIRYGGRYTQAEIKEVVKYATERFITVIPEIEMPGHASAAIAAHPELSCFPNEDTKVAKGTAWAGSTKGKQVQQAWGVFDDIFCAGNDNTFKFLEGVLDEVVPLFPSKYIHIGGDEAPKTHWKRCPKCQQRIKDLGLKDEHELQSYFIQRIEKYLNSKGKQIIGWDEILEGGLAPNATVMSWQGEKGGIEAAKQGHNVIMTPGNWCYFDHAQSRNEDSVTIGGYTPIEEVYSYEPVPNYGQNTLRTPARWNTNSSRVLRR
ncbi:MAG: beta-N-acetylhexosaminidase [Chitinophagaceae bacterium]|nr:beta-N-acetylhexosaminidase [Chitinophagaceae bacterium]